MLICTLAYKQELLKKNKTAKSRRIGAHLLSFIFDIIISVWEDFKFGLELTFGLDLGLQFRLDLGLG